MKLLGTQPLLSIITVCLNDKNNLLKTIKSIRHQSSEQFEFIVIDGHSKDGTLDVIKENEDIIYHWVSESDGGLYDAMNKGMAIANGVYIQFLNAGDEFYDNHTLSNILNATNTNPDIIYGAAIVVNQKGNYQSPYHKKLPLQASWQEFINGMVICHQAIICKKDVSNPYETNAYKVSADIDWAIRIFKNAKSVINLGIPICKFQSGGVSSKRKRLAIWERNKILMKHFGIWKAACRQAKILFAYLN